MTTDRTMPILEISVVMPKRRQSAKPTKYAFDERSDPEISEFVRTFGGFVKKARLEAKMTQEELAEQSGVDRSHISDIERGINAPSLVVLFKLARGLQTDPTKLLCSHEHYNCERARKEQGACDQLF